MPKSGRYRPDGEKWPLGRGLIAHCVRDDPDASHDPHRPTDVVVVVVVVLFVRRGLLGGLLGAAAPWM